MLITTFEFILSYIIMALDYYVKRYPKGNVINIVDVR